MRSHSVLVWHARTGPGVLLMVRIGAHFLHQLESFHIHLFDLDYGNEENVEGKRKNWLGTSFRSECGSNKVPLVYVVDLTAGRAVKTLSYPRNTVPKVVKVMERSCSQRRHHDVYCGRSSSCLATPPAVFYPRIKAEVELSLGFYVDHFNFCYAAISPIICL